MITFLLWETDSWNTLILHNFAQRRFLYYEWRHKDYAKRYKIILMIVIHLRWICTHYYRSWLLNGSYDKSNYWLWLVCLEFLSVHLFTRIITHTHTYTLLPVIRFDKQIIIACNLFYREFIVHCDPFQNIFFNTLDDSFYSAFYLPLSLHLIVSSRNMLFLRCLQWFSLSLVHYPH